MPDQEEKAQGDQLPIIGATFADENSAYIAYGNDVLAFEKLVRIHSYSVETFNFFLKFNVIILHRIWNRPRNHLKNRLVYSS